MFKQYRKIFLVICSMMIVAVTFKFSATKANDMELEIALDTDNQNAALILVHVDGAVKEPGVYELEAEARVKDALDKAGGTLATANTEHLNLAGFLEDGQKISVLGNQVVTSSDDNHKDESKGESTYNIEAYTLLEKINYMTEEEYDDIPGIGSKISSDIISYREHVGQFHEVDDLLNVSGIGEQKLNDIIAFLNR